MTGTLSAKQLEDLADAGEVDTVLCMFTDLQGRFMGKRVVPHFFFEEILGEEGLHACLYLLAIDMEMEPLPGYEYASWETGYGDFRMVPDMSTLRWCPWIEKTVMVICDIFEEEEADNEVEVTPRTILKRQIARAAELGYTIKTGSELEFYLFRDSYRDTAERGYRELRPSSPYIMDYHMLQTTRDEWFVRQVRNAMLGAGIPVEFSKGEFGRGQQEINITYSDALSNADHHALYKHGVKEMAELNGVAATFMAKWTMAEAGSSCHLHSSVWNADGTESLMWSDEGEHHMSDTYRWYMGGLMACAREMAWMYAPFVNSYGDRVEPRQSDVRVPDGRRAHGCTGRVPDPRGRREPVPRVRGDDRRRPVGDRERGGDAPRIDGRARGVWRLRVRAPAEHGAPGAGDLRQHHGHRLGARPLLRTRVGVASGGPIPPSRV